MSKKSEAGIIWLEDLRKGDIPLVGGKNANLGELLGEIGAPVPPGFAITAKMYGEFMEEAGLGEQVDEVLKNLDTSNLSA
ncbi:MAG: PEP/pyruvate-binding domain-containing protein, partial [Syntrophobacterales bacterium]